MTNDVILVHYGVKGMRWGISRESGGGVSKSAKRLATGSAAGAAGGAALATYAAKKAGQVLRSKSFSKKLATKALDMTEMKKITKVVAKPFVAKKILKKNIKIADMLSTPASKASIAVGGAVVAGLLGYGVAKGVNAIVSARENKTDPRRDDK